MMLGSYFNNAPLPFSNPPKSIGDTMDTIDGVYMCIKSRDSVFLWCNTNFATLVGSTPEKIIGTRDSRMEHVEYDEKVIAAGKPIYNLHETIDVPMPDGTMKPLNIVTQKGLLRKQGSNEIIGITVNFVKRFPNVAEEMKTYIETLNLSKSRLGGYFGEGSPKSDITICICTDGFQERCNAEEMKTYSMNYFMLLDNEVLKLHMLNQDEQWFYHNGSAIRIHMFDMRNTIDVKYTYVDVGSRIADGQLLQYSVPHNVWFGAEVLEVGYSMCSCSLSPAWTESSTHSVSQQDVDALLAHFHEHHEQELIKKLANYC
jgi:hypothetical protein